MYLNVYVPHLQTAQAVVGCLHVHRGQRFASTTAVVPMSEAFVRNIEQFVADERIDLVSFAKGERKDDVTQMYLRRFHRREGVLYVGKAQEKARVMRTERRRSRRTGGTYPWIVESTAMVNHYYFYCVDEDFGPFFLKFCSYFPYNAKLCINGHEYLKRQLAKRGVKNSQHENLTHLHQKAPMARKPLLTAPPLDLMNGYQTGAIPRGACGCFKTTESRPHNRSYANAWITGPGLGIMANEDHVVQLKQGAQTLANSAQTSAQTVQEAGQRGAR